MTRELMTVVGPRSYVFAGSADTWLRSVWCAHLDLDGRGFIAGRTAARLHGLDGFTSNAIEALLPRATRHMAGPWTVRSTRADLTRGSTLSIGGIRCLTVHRLILEAPIFRFTRDEIENAIDSALRLRKASEQQLRTDVVRLHRARVNGSRILFDALVDTGGESRLERRFLKLVREAGLPRPALQRVYRSGTRLVARVDADFGDGRVVEVEGHRTHSSRQQRQADERRRNDLRGRVRSLTVFTYDHVTYEPDYVVSELRRILS
ncbi:MAG TPA: hypothetical protein PKV27_03395 [Ilumatobacteraceae bacterium]|nr:hypothetical protein [Ilumatobacteraceae bacterium]